VFGWLVLQVADVLFPALHLPDWSITLVAVLLGIGFIPVLVFSWAYELTSDGLKRESQVARTQSITHATARKLDLITIAMVIVAAVVLIADRMLLDRSPSTSLPASTRPDTTPVVAVLPFKATGSDDGGFLAGGLHDDLLTRLAKLEAFKVISRTSMMEYAERPANMREIGEDLGASHILEGGVQARGDRVRINVQLIDAVTDEHLWADTYDRRLAAEDLFNMQADLATSIASQLRLTLSDSDRAVIAEVPTHNTAAYNAYLHALSVFESGDFNVAETERMISSLEEAVRLDPAFGIAWAMLSRARTRAAALSDDESMARAALVAYARARLTEPQAQEVDLALVSYLYRRMFEYELALDVLDESSAPGGLSTTSLELKAWLLKRLGQATEAYRTMLEAQQLEPRSVSIAGSLVELALRTGDCGAAAEHAADAFSLAPDSITVKTHAANYELECTGDARRALDWMAGVNFESEQPWVAWTAWTAAFMAREYEMLLDWSTRLAQHADADFRLVSRMNGVIALRHLAREKEAKAALATVGEDLATLENDGSDQSYDHAAARALYHSLLGDAESTRRWVETYRQRLRNQTKGDRSLLAFHGLFFAEILATAGLLDEAIAELRSVLTEPLGHTFVFIDAYPAFDVLKSHPAYVELRERYGDRQSSG
jgi:TolB-like protein